MPTTISRGDFFARDPHNGSLHLPQYGKTELIGYCIESPIEVLRHVYKTHLVANYRGLISPVVVPERVQKNEWGQTYGLVIDDADDKQVTPGLSITGKFSQLDLQSAWTRRRMGTNRERHEEALKRLIRYCFGYPGDEKSHWPTYDSLEETIKNRVFDCMFRCQSNDAAARAYHEEEKLILEVASVTLGLTNPTVDTLDELLFGKKSKPQPAVSGR